MLLEQFLRPIFSGKRYFNTPVAIQWVKTSVVGFHDQCLLVRVVVGRDFDPFKPPRIEPVTHRFLFEMRNDLFIC